jgi:hypothetical protein
LADLEAEDGAAFRNCLNDANRLRNVAINESLQNIKLKCIVLSTFSALALAVAHDRLMPCMETRPQYCVFKALLFGRHRDYGLPVI